MNAVLRIPSPRPTLQSFGPSLSRTFFASRTELAHTHTCPFDKLVPWASFNLSSNSTVSVVVRDREDHPFQIQHALLSQVSDPVNAPLRIVDRASPTLDLTHFEPAASLTFLFWLFNHRLPRLREDCLQPSIQQAHSRAPRAMEDRIDCAENHIMESFCAGHIDAWRLGYAIRAPRFQNDIMLRVASLLSREEAEAPRSMDPTYSSAIAWARRAFDATADLRGRQMRDFAVDVAAKRVYYVGINGLALKPSERLDLSSCEQFASEVFGSLGGQIGTKGVDILDFAKTYLIEEEEKDLTRR